MKNVLNEDLLLKKGNIYNYVMQLYHSGSAKANQKVLS